jgi:hypothetical protein
MANWFLIGTTLAMLVVFAVDTVKGRREDLRRK